MKFTAKAVLLTALCAVSSQAEGAPGNSCGACVCLSQFCVLGLEGTSATKRHAHLYRPSTVLIYRQPDNTGLLLAKAHTLKLGADISNLACGVRYRGRSIDGTAGDAQPPSTWGACVDACNGDCIGVTWQVSIQDPSEYFASTGFCTHYISGSTTNDNAANDVFSRVRTGCAEGTFFSHAS